jgi:septum formation protein
LSSPVRHIYLASRSPRRREILTQIGVHFEMLLLRDAVGRDTDVDETPHPGEDPADYVLRLAEEKAETGWARLVQRKIVPAPVLAADTTVTLDGEIIGKPVDRADAAAILRRLSGREHIVHTAVAVQMDRRRESILSSTRVLFGELSADAIAHYVASGEPMDKAGAYGVQGRASVFVRHLDGSYTGVMGLPTYETAWLLNRFGLPLP